MKTLLRPQRLISRGSEIYSVSLAKSASEIEAAQSLRFKVFNLELNEGLDASFATQLDQDPFDEICDHLIVRWNPTGEIVGTYRLQTGTMAAAGSLGYYSAQEFDLSPFEPVRHELVELGRACVERKHRNLRVLGLLWKGIAEYCQARGGRYLIGCSSVTSEDPRVGAELYFSMAREHLVDPCFRTLPLPTHLCALDEGATTAKAPKLFRAYLSLGAKICGPPALDSEFHTIDFLTFLDLKSLDEDVLNRFMPSAG